VPLRSASDRGLGADERESRRHEGTKTIWIGKGDVIGPPLPFVSSCLRAFVVHEVDGARPARSTSDRGLGADERESRRHEGTKTIRVGKGDVIGRPLPFVLRVFVPSWFRRWTVLVPRDRPRPG